MQSCDPCRSLPPSSAAHRTCYSTASAGSSCDESQCTWVVSLEATLGVVWEGAHGAARGWGNSFSYLRNLHELAAGLGRRLVVYPHRAYLPTDSLLLGGTRTWATPSVEAYLAQPRASALKDPFQVTREIALKGANRTEYRALLLQWLDRERGPAQHPHVFLNFTREAMYVITKAPMCSSQLRHRPGFQACIGRLFTTPRPHSRLAIEYASARAGLLAGRRGDGAEPPPPPPQAFPIHVIASAGSAPQPPTPHVVIGVHTRTFGVDMGIPRTVVPDAQAALAFYAWEVRVNAREYTDAARKVCTRGVEQRSLWVASDARAAVLMWRQLCPGQVHAISLATVREHSEAHRNDAILNTGGGIGDSGSGGSGSGGNSGGNSGGSGGGSGSGGSGGSGSSMKDVALISGGTATLSGRDALLLDWLLLASSGAILRWGAQHSSFASSAHMRSCDGKLWRSPKSFRYASASAWLLNKVRLYTSMGRHQNASWDCNSPIAPMLRTTPCTSGCLRDCRALIYSAFT